MFANIPMDVLEKIERNPNVFEAKPAEFPRGDLDGENSGSYSVYTDPEERSTSITVFPTDTFPGAVYFAMSGRNFQFFTQSKINIPVECKNPDGTHRVFNIKFNTAEAAFHCYKASLFGDFATFEKIYYAETPKEAKALGRTVKLFRDEYWKGVAPLVATLISSMKLEQCSEVRDFVSLLAAHSAKHNIPFPDNFRVIEARDDQLYGSGVDHKTTVQMIVNALVADKPEILHKKLTNMENDTKFTFQRQMLPNSYPLTGFFIGQDWMGCSITGAIKHYYATKLKRAGGDTDASLGSPKRAKTDRDDPVDFARQESSSVTLKADEAPSAVFTRTGS
jgi:predicted NAD-dependent protein-ADP-ribosyltransferase YbiA (DUF1768 family)